MTPEQYAKLPEGTEVLIRATKLKNSVGNNSAYLEVTQSGGRVYLKVDAVEAEAPRRPLKVGDLVRGDGIDTPCKIEAIVGRNAWCSYGSSMVLIADQLSLKRWVAQSTDKANVSPSSIDWASQAWPGISRFSEGIGRRPSGDRYF